MQEARRGKGARRLWKRVAVVAAAAMLVLAAIAMAGCSNSEQVIRDGIAEQLDHYKNADEVAMAEAEGAMSASDAEMLGIDPEELGRSLLEGFDYTIDSVTVDGKSAEAVVTVTCKSLGGFDDAMEGFVDEAADDPSVTSVSDVYRLVGAKSMEYVDGLPVQTREPVTFTFNLVGNNWMPTAESQRIFSTLITK